MKLVTYSKDEYYFLTDEEFEKAAESWADGKPILFKSKGLYLPQPRRPVSIPNEHAGLQLAFSFDEDVYGLPGWIGIRKPMLNRETKEEIKPGALFVRVKDHGNEFLKYRWHRLGDMMDSAEVKEFIRALKPVMSEDILNDEELRTSIPFEPLLTEYYLN